MKNYRVYNTEQGYLNDKPNLGNLDTYAALSKENNKIFVRKGFEISDAIIQPSKSGPADICLYDKTADKLVIVKGDLFLVDYFPADKYTPIGIVVVPGSHNVYNDGSCGVVSLKEMNYKSPDDGSTSKQFMYWGGSDIDISTLINYDQVCYVGNNGNVGENVIGTNNYAYLPSDRFSIVANPYDTETGYYYNDDNKYIPSPYNNDGSFNAEYSRTSSPSNTSNAMSDFDGVGNTQIITDLATSQSDWKTASSITNTSFESHYPAACCCWRYHTEGTNQGDWYLPACGELGYIMSRFNKINEAIQKMITAYSSSVGVYLSTDYYWSSSRSGSGYIRSVDMNNGYVKEDYRFNQNYVRAFIRVK